MPKEQADQQLHQQTQNTPLFNFEHSYSELPANFYSHVKPAQVEDPKLVLFNKMLATQLELETKDIPEHILAQIMASGESLTNSKPIAQAYAGHQFGHFTMLGDGRAILLGEHITNTGQRYDIQLKGGGRTPYSRGGDGKAALGPMLREYIISEAMHALGIPTTRSLAVVATNEPVFRENTFPGAVLTRVAASHIRVGTFEYAVRLPEPEAIRILTDYTIERHYPQLAEDIHSENIYVAFFENVMLRQIKLITQWISVGFIHGVMNTDNMALSGETIDYGPCAFMDVYDPSTVFSSIDRDGRYAFGNQPAIAHWNLTRLAETLLPLFHEEQNASVEIARASLARFPELFERELDIQMNKKLGLHKPNMKTGDNKEIIQNFLKILFDSRADYTNAFRALCDSTMEQPDFFNNDDFRQWRVNWNNRLQQLSISQAAAMQSMQSVNPFVIPRNQRVEEALLAANEKADYSKVNHLLQVLDKPYATNPKHLEFTREPGDTMQNYKTFCGT
ncbi:MAG: YdiU family protein [Leptospiraceae bacterium]|nr:YdiU family protein [Leptospiraceae bacterium]